MDNNQGPIGFGNDKDLSLFTMTHSDFDALLLEACAAPATPLHYNLTQNRSRTFPSGAFEDTSPTFDKDGVPVGFSGSNSLLREIREISRVLENGRTNDKCSTHFTPRCPPNRVDTSHPPILPCEITTARQIPNTDTRKQRDFCCKTSNITNSTEGSRTAASNRGLSNSIKL